MLFKQLVDFGGIINHLLGNDNYWRKMEIISVICKDLKTISVYKKPNIQAAMDQQWVNCWSIAELSIK